MSNTKTAIRAVGSTDAKTPVTSTKGTNPKLTKLIESYKSLVKARSDSIIELSKTLVTAQKDLGTEELNMFCKQVGLDPKSRTFRKFILIGNRAARFQPYLEQLPATWTMVYRLAKLTDAKFNKVMKSDSFSPFMTGKSIKAIVKSNVASVSNVAA